jgi:hypothetical protein
MSVWKAPRKMQADFNQKLKAALIVVIALAILLCWLFNFP